MMLANRLNRRHEELANSLTACTSLVLSLIGFPFLIWPACVRGGASAIWSAAIFGGTLILLHMSSTMYHSVRGPRVKYIWQVIDHSCIYLLIAGTYTPLALISLRNGGGIGLFAAIWSLAFFGVLTELFYFDRPKLLSLCHYFLMGWLGIFAARALFNSVPAWGLLLILIGSILYSIGVIFYIWKQLPYSHAVWHLFVLTGGMCHYFAVFYHVVPTALS